MDINISVKINNIDASSGTVRVTNDYPVITWSFTQNPELEIIVDEYFGELEENFATRQESYEIRISTSKMNLGEQSFIGNRIETSSVRSSDRFWNYYGIPLKRGGKYYGQIRVQDDFGRYSEWETFGFVYNNLPVVSNADISPSQPSVTDNLIFSYSFFDRDSDLDRDSSIRWFKNGVHQRQFDNILTIRSNFLQIGDIWSVDIVPFDGYEEGERVSSQSVAIVKTSITLSDIKVLPENPNENSLFKADYSISELSEEKNVSVRWFINGQYDSQYDDMIYIRPDVSPGDIIRCEVKASKGTYFYSSEEKTIGYSDFIVNDIMVDGRKETFDVSTTMPVIGWKNRVPEGLSVNYTSIKIGTFYEASNIYSEIIENDREVFIVPANLLERGKDYYVSIAISNTASFDNYSIEHFRIIGSRWEEDVNNSVGWTIEVMYLIESSESFNEDKYQFIRFNDGTYYGEVRIYSQKLSFISEDITTSVLLTTSGMNLLTIATQGTDIKIYLNRNLVIDGVLTQESSEKTLAFGNDTGTKDNFTIRYKYFSYSVSGSYPPGSIQYTTVQFHTYLNFRESEVVAMKGYIKNYKEYKVFAVNPDDITEGGSVFALESSVSTEASTVSRTLAPINSIKKSLDSSKIVFAHSKGISVIEGYVINSFDNEIIFVDDNDIVYQIFPPDRNWLLIQNTGLDSAYFDENGFNINTIRDT